MSRHSDMPAIGAVPTDREGTYRQIIHSLQDNPAYLLVFAIGLLGGAMGLGTTTVGLFNGNVILAAFGFATWALLLGATLLVIRMVERRPSHAFELDNKAREAFVSIPGLALELGGTWKVNWFQGEGDQRVPYSSSPEERIDVQVTDGVVSCRSYDPTTEKTYWLYGRTSEPNVLTLIYWSQRDALKGTARLSGVVMAQAEATFDGMVMKGWWQGFTRNDQIASGEVEWIKLG